MQDLYHNHKTSAFRNFDQVNLYIIPILSQQTDRIGHFIGNREIPKVANQAFLIMFPFMPLGV